MREASNQFAALVILFGIEKNISVGTICAKNQIRTTLYPILYPTL